MPRKPRKHSSLNIYHVVVKGINSQLLFEERRDYVKYLELLEYYKENCKFNLYAYCLMTNHIHLLIQANAYPLDSIFRKINTAYANWFNMKYSRTGPLQEGRYYSEPIESLDSLLSVLRYIHKNPLSAHLESQVGSQYTWNSFHDYLKNRNHLVDIDVILNEFANINDFIDFHSCTSDRTFIDINTIRKRIPDDVAIDIISEVCGTNHTEDIKNFSLSDRRNAIFAIYEKGISARQINRLTGIPRGIIDRILSNRL